MGRLPPAFEPNGIITAGNASAVVDGAAAMVIGRESDAERHGAKPLARVIGMGVAACDPQIMGWGPVPATRKALDMAGMSGSAIDIVELNEAFAPQALACIRDFEKMGIDPEKVNPHGERDRPRPPARRDRRHSDPHVRLRPAAHRRRYGLVTMCIGGGQGIALVLESA